MDSQKTDAYELMDSQKTDAYRLMDPQKTDAYEMTMKILYNGFSEN